MPYLGPVKGWSSLEMKTYSVTPKDIKKEWLIVDATDKTLGRLATEVARVLRGKHKPSFVPHLDCGDNVVVVNAAKVKLTGDKWKDKTYYSHSTYIGGIKAIKAEDLVKTYPDRIVTFAVRGMLPKTKLGRKVLKNLKVYGGTEHPHLSQKPTDLRPRLAGEK